MKSTLKVNYHYGMLKLKSTHKHKYTYWCCSGTMGDVTHNAQRYSGQDITASAARPRMAYNTGDAK